MAHKVIVFGEMLWDCLPSGAKPGGAPMNVALNLHQLGIDTRLISAIGNDEDGEKLLSYYKSFGISEELIQITSDHATSQVLVDSSDPENIKYSILPDVAWDYITIKEDAKTAVKSSDAFVFGTLGVRNKTSLQTLLELLHHANLKVFDANLRPPFYDFEIIEMLLGFTDILKINEDELEIFADYFNTVPEPKSLCQFLDKKFPIDIICITLGSKGALIYQNGSIFHHKGYKIQVKDTIGAGDAFLSGFIWSLLKKKSPEQILDFACKIGAYMATQEGGAPKYKRSDIEKIT